MADSPAGWNRDPYGRHELRYFDGAIWTEHVSDQGVTAVDPPIASPPPPSASAPQAVPYQVLPVQPKKKLRWPWVVGGLFLVFCLGFAGCIALIGTAANEAVKELNREQAAHAITRAQFDAISLGISRDDLLRQLGKEPEDSQEFVTKGILNQQDVQSSCVYYNKVGGTFGDRFQFCFNGDSLQSKNAY
ncbi:MAG: DUF2510 domain-containing protein [Acidimicrobiia bacterium]